MKIVADAYIQYVDDYFAMHGELKKIIGREITAADVKDADMLLVRSITPVNKALLAGSNVKFVGSMTAGADHLDTEWLDAAGIKWSTVAGFNAPPVADYVVSMIAALMQRRVLPQRNIKAAVIGVGHVGKLVVERLKLLDIHYVMCDPLRAKSEVGFQSQDLDAIKDVDLILLHVPLTREGDYPTYHMINEEFTRRQKNGCVIVNAARGAVVDPEAMIKHGAHITWCLDVYENEPAVDRETLERATLTTPHIAGYSVQSKMRGMEMLYKAACDAGVIEAGKNEPVKLPRQLLAYSGTQYHWQDIVLGVFNPVVMTAMMRSTILPAEHADVVFDELRNRFDYRHEFAYTDIPGLALPDPQDVRILARLGFDLNSR